MLFTLLSVFAMNPNLNSVVSYSDLRTYVNTRDLIDESNFQKVSMLRKLEETSEKLSSLRTLRKTKKIKKHKHALHYMIERLKPELETTTEYERFKDFSQIESYNNKKEQYESLKSTLDEVRGLKRSNRIGAKLNKILLSFNTIEEKKRVLRSHIIINEHSIRTRANNYRSFHLSHDLKDRAGTGASSERLAVDVRYVDPSKQNENPLDQKFSLITRDSNGAVSHVYLTDRFVDLFSKDTGDNKSGCIFSVRYLTNPHRASSFTYDPDIEKDALCINQGEILDSFWVKDMRKDLFAESNKSQEVPYGRTFERDNKNINANLFVRKN